MEPKSTCSHHSNPTFSQCLSIRKQGKSILDGCCNADKASISDFKSVYHGGDVTMLSDCDEVENEVLATSLADTSYLDNECAVKAEPAANQPYAPFSVEEVSLVKSLDFWSNHNVRIVGQVTPTSPSNNVWTLKSIGEEGGPFSLFVDFRLVEKFPPPDCIIQVFGELQLLNNSCPVILAKFFRDFSSVDIFYYNKASLELSKYVPHFVGTKKMCQRRLDDGD